MKRGATVRLISLDATKAAGYYFYWPVDNALGYQETCGVWLTGRDRRGREFVEIVIHGDVHKVALEDLEMIEEAQMKTAVVIPARLASTRLPRKVMRDILGKPLIQWVHDGCKEFCDDVWVITPDAEIVKAVYEFGGEAIKTPPAANVLDRASYAAGRLKEQDYEYIIVAQGDEPMIIGGMLELVMSAHSDAGVVQLIKPLAGNEDPWNPNIPKVIINKLGEIIYASRCPIPGTTPELDHSSTTTYYKQVCVMRFAIDILSTYAHVMRGPIEAAEGIDILRFIEHNWVRILAVKSHYDTKAVDTAEDLEEVTKLLRRRGREGR